jgi:hypothetical protein
MVGQKFLESLDEASLRDLQVTVLCEEPRPAYDRVHLSDFFSGRSAADLSLVPGLLRPPHLDLQLGARAASIDRAAKTVTTAGGDVVAYDKLVLATGSSPFVPPVPGRDRPDCFVYRTIEDLEAMLECGARSRSGVVIGGGLLGLECAKALRDMQLRRTWSSSPAAPDGAAGRRRRRPRCCAAASRNSASGAHRQEHRWPSWTGRVRATGWSSPTAATWRPTCWCSRPASGRATNWRARRAWPSAPRRHRHRRPRAHQRSGHLRHRRMRGLERPGVRPGGARLRHGPRRGGHLAGQPAPSPAPT